MVHLGDLLARWLSGYMWWLNLKMSFCIGNIWLLIVVKAFTNDGDMVAH